jgi:hypothetical protein
MSIERRRLSSTMNIKLRFFLNILLWIIVLSAVSVSCTPASSERIALASFAENYVDVSIYLERNSAGNYFLSGTFSPPTGYHLYSKDIPLTGVNGLGRPTLLELTSESQMKAIGELMESVKGQEPSFEPKELRVYPLGGVTLSLHVELPPGIDWINDEIKLTYMTCNDSQCKPPVEGKIISVRIPSSDATK